MMKLIATPENIFGIPNPTEWWCRVSHLASVHTTMRVDVIQQNQITPFGEMLHLDFSKVQYFSGWMIWTGANFRLASDEEKLAFVASNVSEENVQFFDLSRLYIADAKDGKVVQIVANAARCVDKDNNTLLEVY
jgi:hypothetical protein